MKRMNLLIMILVILIITQSCGSGKKETLISTSFQAEIESLMLEKNVPTLGIAIIENGKLRHTKVFGKLKNSTAASDSTIFNSISHSNQGFTKDTPAPDNAIFNIASLTKPISALLTLTLVSNGAWDLEEPLYHYWIDPDIKDDPYLKILTTRHVLTQQSGFDNWRWLNSSNKLAFNFKPGTQCKYSGEGFKYLKLAIEHKFNTPFEELADSLLFEPYGMKDTRFLWDENFHKYRYAEEHNKKGEPYKLRKRIHNASAADDVLTTIKDYGLFAVNVMKASGLTEDIYNDMINPQAIVKENVAYGLCWYIKQNYYEAEAALTHTGGDAGVCTKVIILPESKRGLIIFTNGDNGFDIIKKVEEDFFASRI